MELRETTPARAILKYQPKPVRPVGHPTNRFQDTLKLDCTRAGPDYRLQNIETVAADRTQRRKFVRAATGDFNKTNFLEQPQETFSIKQISIKQI